jgi:hypothetical protein
VTVPTAVVFSSIVKLVDELKVGKAALAPARDTTEILIEVANTTTDLAIILKLTLLRLNILVSPF